jgi:ribonuclease P protein component
MNQFRCFFKAGQKVRKSPEYQLILKTGRKVTSNYFKLYFVEKNIQTTRFGVIISRIIKGSVIRNRFKRLIREFLRLNQHRIKRGVLLVVILSKPLLPANYPIFDKELQNIIKTAKLLIAEHSSG